MAAVDVIILHPLAAEGAGPLERRLADARAALAERQRRSFLVAGARSSRVVAGLPDGRPFGQRLLELRADLAPGSGLVLLGSGALPLATARDRRAFVTAAGGDDAAALANNRYSADAIALSGPAVARLDRLPPDLPGDNALPRWLEEIAGVSVTDLRSRWRLGFDLDSPLDLLLAGRTAAGRSVSQPDRSADGSASRLPDGPAPAPTPIERALDGVRRILADPTAELVVAGRSSAATLAWLERETRCRVRSLIEERGLRASSRLAVRHASTSSPTRTTRPPRSVLGLVIDRDGPEALGARLAELGDAALVDSRVLLAHRLGADEAGWPPPEDRFASDLLEAEAVADPWLAALTASAAAATIPIVMGGHSLVGPGVRLVAGTPGR